MGTVLFHPPSILTFPTKHPKLGTPKFFSKEFADGSQKYLPRFKVLCMIPDGIRKGQPPKNISSKKTQETSGNDITALLRKFEVSILKKLSSSTQSSAAGFLEDFIQSRNLEKTPVNDGNVQLTKLMRKRKKRNLKGKSTLGLSTSQLLKRQLPAHWKSSQPPEDQSAAILESTRQLGIQKLVDLKSTRPRSSFVKRSPIPPQSTQRGMIPEELNNETSPGMTIESEKSKLPIVGKMKVAELREIAKSRGIEGYSKLKKKELLAMLNSQE